MRIRRTREPEVIVVQDDESAKSTEVKRRKLEDSTWSSGNEVPRGSRGTQEERCQWTSRVGCIE